MPRVAITLSARRIMDINRRCCRLVEQNTSTETTHHHPTSTTTTSTTTETESVEGTDTTATTITLSTEKGCSLGNSADILGKVRIDQEGNIRLRTKDKQKFEKKNWKKTKVKLTQEIINEFDVAKTAKQDKRLEREYFQLLSPTTTFNHSIS